MEKEEHHRQALQRTTHKGKGLQTTALQLRMVFTLLKSCKKKDEEQDYVTETVCSPQSLKFFFKLHLCTFLIKFSQYPSSETGISRDSLLKLSGPLQEIFAPTRTSEPLLGCKIKA